MARTSDQLARLKRRMNAIPKHVRRAVEPALDKSADELVGRMQSLAPVDDGTLRNSITKDAGEHALQRTVTAGDDEAFYARMVEFGTIDTPSQAFFYPSYRLLKKRITNRIKRAVGKAVRDGWQA